MHSSIFSKLAVTNLKNNRKMYVPYMLTAILTVMMYYIIHGLSTSADVENYSSSLHLMLEYAAWVVAIFAGIFLFYTNSFLMKRRKKEIGVYNILGMGKWHIAKMLMVETVITSGICILAGIAFGVIFSKLMFLVLLKLLQYEIPLGFSVSQQSLMATLLLFVAIFMLILLFHLLQIKLANPIELLHGSNQGEKEPKTKWLLTIFGIITIGIGYYIALTTDSPLTAIGMFFIAVICVILGTYALFIAGSIAFLKLLRKNKNYYYQTRHFTAVSGMIYRMKQNAVGLANICILSTMVLIMVSTTVSLYAGMEDVLDTRFPKDFLVTIRNADSETEAKAVKLIEEDAKKNGIEISNSTGCHYASFSTTIHKNQFLLMQSGNYSTEETAELHLIPLADYNRIEHADMELDENEVLVYSNTKKKLRQKTIQLGNDEYVVKQEPDAKGTAGSRVSYIMDTYYIVLKDTTQMQKYLDQVYQSDDISEVIRAQNGVIRYEYSFDLKGGKDKTVPAMKEMWNHIVSQVPNAECEVKELSRESFYSLYGGLLFIGIYLGLMFLMATVLIIYYKQISEGYDDRDRYQIMQKVGMSKKEVKGSIKSQILTVFFLPLVVAVIHIAFAFRIVTKLLAVLNLVNVPLFIGCTIITAALFAVFYAIVYALTAREYYRLVE